MGHSRSDDMCIDGYSSYSSLVVSSYISLYIYICGVVSGILKGYDLLLNLVLDQSQEWLRDPFDPHKITGNERIVEYRCVIHHGRYPANSIAYLHLIP